MPRWLDGVLDGICFAVYGAIVGFGAWLITLGFLAR